MLPTQYLVEFGIDGNAAYALHGENIQIGECAFVVIESYCDKGVMEAQLKAFSQLLERLSKNK